MKRWPLMGVAAWTAFIGWHVAMSVTYQHDPAWAIVAASGQLSSAIKAFYHDKHIEPAVAPASYWQAMRVPLPTTGLGEIRHQMNAEETHPPLFVWMLYAVMLMTGDARALPWLNCALAIPTAILLWLTVRRWSGTAAANLALLLWVTSFATFKIVVDSRIYAATGLFGLMVVSGLWSYLSGERRERIMGLLFFGAGAALGALTHYPFPLVIAAALIASAPRLRAIPRSRIAPLVMTLAAAGAAAIAFNPGLFGSFRQHEQMSMQVPFDLTNIILHVRFCFVGIAQAVLETNNLATRTLAGLVGYAVVGWLLWWAVRDRRELLSRTARGDAEVYFAVSAVLYLLMHAFLYMSFIYPVHAYRDRYLSVFWFLAAAAGAPRLLRAKPMVRHSFAMVWIVGIGLCALTVTRQAIKTRQLASRIYDADVVVNNPRTLSKQNLSNTLRLAWLMKPSAQLLLIDGTQVPPPLPSPREFAGKRVLFANTVEVGWADDVTRRIWPAEQEIVDLGRPEPFQEVEILGPRVGH